VDYDDGVGALVGDVVDEGVGEVVIGSRAVPAFLGPGVDEDEAGVGIVVDGGAGTDIDEVPE
jgi:hypothetical protein